MPAWIALAYALGMFVIVGMLGDATTEEQEVVIGGLVVLGLVLVFLAWKRRKAIVGAEAIAIRWVFTERTLRFVDVRRAAPDGHKRVTLTTMSGETMELSTGYFAPALSREVLERLWKAIAAGAEEGSRGTERETLARSGRSTKEWLTALRALGSPASYRSSTFSTDRLWAIVENPGITTEVRAGAVVALTAAPVDTAMRERFRRVGEAAVDPSLTLLLDDLASGNGLEERALDTVGKT